MPGGIGLVLHPVALPSALPAGTQFVLNENNLHLTAVFPDGRILDLTARPSNQLINGGFDHAQRQVPGTLTTRTTTTGRIYTADRWFATTSAADLQYQRIDTAAGLETGLTHRFYGKFKKITGTGKFLAGQIVPGDVTSGLQGRQVRFQAQLKRSVATALNARLGLAYLTAAGTIDTVPGFVSGAPSGTFVSAFNVAGTDPTLGTNISYLTPVAGSMDGGTIIGNGVTAPTTTIWDLVGANFNVPVDAKNLIPLIWTDGVPAINDELNIGEAGLYDGTAQQEWEARSSHLELIQCQRFYHKSFPLNSAPAQNFTVAAGGHVKGTVTTAGAVATAHFGVKLPTRMRAAPTLTFYNPAAANAFLRNITLATDATATSGTSITDDGFDLTATGLAAWAVGNSVAVQFQADAEL